MPKIEIVFRGICTHLVATHRNPDMPGFELWADNEPIQHRIVLPNSALINSRIDPDRHVVSHVPKMRIPTESVHFLPGCFYEDRDARECILEDVAIGFTGVAHEIRKPDHPEALKRLPHLGNETRLALEPRQAVLSGWTHYASAYVDFPGESKGRTSCVTFKYEDNHPDSTVAEVHFSHEPTLVFRPCNSDKGAIPFTVSDGCRIEISNLPSKKACSPSDYLLHYFVTTLDISRIAPEWPKPDIPTDEDIAALKQEGRASDVYCSNGTFP